MKIKDFLIKKLGGYTRNEYTRETARLGAIIDCHIDDGTWLMEQLGIVGKDEHYKFRFVGCRVNREKLKNEWHNIHQ